MQTNTKTPREVVLGIILAHGPISGSDLSAKCRELGYENTQSLNAHLYWGRVKGKIKRLKNGSYRA